MLRVSLPGASNATTVVRVPAGDDDERVRERVEGALRGILSGGTGHRDDTYMTSALRGERGVAKR